MRQPAHLALTCLLALAACLGLTALFTLLAILTFNPQHAAPR